MSLDDKIRGWISEALAQHAAPFDYLLKRFRDYYEKPAHKLSDFEQRTTKAKGDLFERFCVLYSQALDNDMEVWQLNDVPEVVRRELALSRRDCGIDIIARKKSSRGGYNYYAIQAKYRAPSSKNSKATTIGWRDLSTFYSLCSRTGPLTTKSLTQDSGSDSGSDSDNKNRRWNRLIVMTTADAIKRKGADDKRDRTFTRKIFVNTSNALWQKIAGVHLIVSKPHSLVSSSMSQMPAQPPLDLLREIRMAFFERQKLSQDTKAD
jgi:hypothetical protein